MDFHFKGKNEYILNKVNEAFIREEF